MANLCQILRDSYDMISKCQLRRLKKDKNVIHLWKLRGLSIHGKFQIEREKPYDYLLTIQT